MTEIKNPVGRPKKTLDDLPKDWKERMLAYGADGASEVEIRMEVLGGICHRTWEGLIKDYGEFCETVNQSKGLCQAWWEKHGRKMARGDCKDGNATIWIFNMKNRFAWRDKTELSSDPDNPVIPPSLTLTVIDTSSDD